MPSLISNETKALLVAQVGHEKYNASVYLRVGVFLESKGFKNLAKHFYEQHEEEQKHSLIISKVLTDLNEDYHMPSVDEVDLDFDSIADIADLYVEREVETTDNLKSIRDMAANEPNGGCPVVEVAMIDMLRLQQAELDEATTFYDRSQNFVQWRDVAIWDISLGDK